MNVKVEMKITVLEGEEAGRIFTENMVTKTEPEYTECGTVEHLNLAWTYIHNVPKVGLTWAADGV